MSGPWEQFSAQSGPWNDFDAPAPVPTQSVPSEFLRQLGLTARAAVKGAAALPNMVADPLVGLYNRVTGSQIPSFSQGQDQALTDLGLPQPKNTTERVVQAGAQSLVPVGGVASVARSVPTLAPLADNLGWQALSSVLGSTASEGAKEGGAGPAGQLAAGLLGGVAGPTALSAANVAARTALRVPGSLLAPFTESGRSGIVAQAFQKAATDARMAADNIQSAPSYVPGVRPTTAELADDTGISALYKALINRQGAPFTDRANANDAARQAYLAQAFGNETTLNAAKAARDAQTAPLRNSALNAANDTTNNILNLEQQIAQKQASKAQALQQYGQMATGAAEQNTFANNWTPVPGMPRVPGILSPNAELVPTYQAGAQDAAKIAAQRQAELEAAQAARSSVPYVPLQSAPLLDSIRGTLNIPGVRSSDVAANTLGDIEAKIAKFTDANGNIDARDLYTIRKEIGNTIETHAKASNNWDKKMTAGLEKNIQGAIDNSIVSAGGTDWPAYLQQYQDLSKGINAMQTGQAITKAATNPGKDQLSQPLFARQMANNAQDVADMGARSSDVLTRVNQDLKRSAAPLNAMRTPGSDTAQNLVGNAMLNGLLGRIPLGPLGSITGKLGSAIYSPMETKTQQLVTNAMLDPRLGAQLLRRPIPQKPDLVAQLSASLFPISYGGLLGTLSNQ
jgi:hypothetical protein